jgi:hypothetical protein
MERVDLVLKKYYGKLSKNFKLAFVAVLVIGLIAHIYMFTNKLPNFDDLVDIDSFGVTFKNGRWFLWILGATMYHLNFCFSMPWMNGLVTLILLGITAGIIADMLKLKSITANVILGGAIVVFPSWTSTFFYMFTAPYYAIAILLGVLSVLFACKGKKNIVIAAIMLACSMGIYQAYLPFIATLYVVLLINECFDDELEWNEILNKAFYYLFSLVAGVVVYFCCMKISLLITGQSLNSYKGISSMGNFDISRFPEIFRTIGVNFFGIFLNNNLELSYNLITKVMYLVLMIISASLLVARIMRLRKKGDNLKLLELIIFVLCYIIAINLIYFMCADGIYSLMYFSYVFMIILPLCLVDRTLAFNTNKFVVGMEYILTFSISFGLISYCYFANGQYLSMDLSYRQAESYFTTLITQIKSVEGYTADTPIAVIGEWGNDSSLYKNSIMDVLEMSGRDNALADAYSWQYLLKYYCGFNAELIGIDEVGIDEAEVESLPCYPEAGSISLVNEVVVIKLSSFDY